MAWNTQMGTPAVNSLKKGQYTLHRVHLSEATAAAPVVPVNMSNIVAITYGEPSFDTEVIQQQGGGDDRVEIKYNWRWDGTITCHGGKGGAVLAAIQNITWNTSNDAVISTRPENDFPVVHWEAVCREKDNTTHLFTVVIQDMIIDASGFDNPMDYTDFTIPFHTYHEPMIACAGAEFVYDVFTGDGSTTDLTLSSTPIKALTASSHDDFYINELPFVKEKASTASTGTRQKSGYSYAAGKAVAATAPTAGTLVQVGYFTRM